MAELKLLPCPFCGGDPQQPETITKPPKHPIWEISCSQMCFSMRRGTRKEVVQGWNKRALKQPRITREQVREIRNLSFECYLPLDGFCEVLRTKYGIEVESAPPEAKV